MKKFEFVVKTAFRYGTMTYMPGVHITQKDNISINEIKNKRKWSFILPVNDEAKKLVNDKIFKLQGKTGATKNPEVAKEQEEVTPGQANAQEQGIPQAQEGVQTPGGVPKEPQGVPAEPREPEETKNPEPPAAPGKVKKRSIKDKIKKIFKKK